MYSQQVAVVFCSKIQTGTIWFVLGFYGILIFLFTYRVPMKIPGSEWNTSDALPSLSSGLHVLSRVSIPNTLCDAYESRNHQNTTVHKNSRFQSPLRANIHRRRRRSPSRRSVSACQNHTMTTTTMTQ